MADINRCVLIGRLTREAELKYTAGGVAISKFSIAVNRKKKNGDQWEDEASYFDIVLYGKKAETLHPYFVKGKPVCVDGELRQDRWQQDGQNRSKVEIIAHEIQLLGSGQKSEGSESNPADRAAQQTTGAPSDDGFANDIPF